MTTQLITREFLKREGACYSDAKIAALIPESGMTALEFLKLNIPAHDRIWGITRSGVIARETMREWLTRLLGRAYAVYDDACDAAYAAADAAYNAAYNAVYDACDVAYDDDAAAAAAAAYVAERQRQINNMIALLSK